MRRRQEVEIQNVGDESTDQNNNITMTSEDLLQPGHVVKERWKVLQGLCRRQATGGPSSNHSEVRYVVIPCCLQSYTAHNSPVENGEPGRIVDASNLTCPTRRISSSGVDQSCRILKYSKQDVLARVMVDLTANTPWSSLFLVA
uniref:Uncharacterized protein n=1 Tax=Timema douglasi TaxID=61478 RepID=A0A7R8VKP9_TIMDO|nr:unnamed protein product [Timema douglasi]